MRYWAIILIILGTSLYLEHRPSANVNIIRQSFHAFPFYLGPWEGEDVPIEKEVVDALGVEDFLDRVYYAADRPPVYLYMGYHRTQEQGATIHSPRNCLPGSGWYPMETGFEVIQIPGREPVKVNCFIIQKGDEVQVVLYWYQAHGRVVASEYLAKLFMMLDAANLNRTDGSLIRVVVPAERSIENSKQIAISFVSSLFPKLDPFIP